MSKTVNIGGNRIGSGNKMNVSMHGYERSSHDLSFLWKSTMSVGTLVPFMNILALPGDTFDIDLNAMVKTHPTIGPLFGSFKLQLDVFRCPIRLYNRILHNNSLNVGMKMSDVIFPTIQLEALNLDFTKDTPIELQQINPSCILSYLGIRGLGRAKINSTYMNRKFNAIPYLAYMEIFKNYYANKQEDDAWVIRARTPQLLAFLVNAAALPSPALAANTEYNITLVGTNTHPENVQVNVNTIGWVNLLDLGDPQVNIFEGGVYQIIVNNVKTQYLGNVIGQVRINPDFNYNLITPSLTNFPLSNIDDMREAIMTDANNNGRNIAEYNISPYVDLCVSASHVGVVINAQEGLLVKTYQSDLFNNWLKTEFVDGENGINAITAISTAGDSFTIDTLNLSKKVYDMLNRIAVSGGSYDDYIEAVYDVKSRWRAETPVYEGGLSKEIVFQEVISNAATQDDPLGSLAGKGIMSDKHKGGHMVINVDEACYLIGIVSITPRISYSQGNDWHVNLLTMDDLHKPALDAIGYQDLITDQMHFGGTLIEEDNTVTFQSAGKQPAWLNYMTNYDRNFGNFADRRSQMFMTLDRNYSCDINGVSDLTTYIDPAKFNYAFAQVDMAAQNFWVQISNNITARRKMSAKLIPNL